MINDRQLTKTFNKFFTFYLININELKLFKFESLTKLDGE